MPWALGIYPAPEAALISISQALQAESLPTELSGKPSSPAGGFVSQVSVQSGYCIARPNSRLIQDKLYELSQAWETEEELSWVLLES